MSHPQWQQSTADKVSLLGDIDRESVPNLWTFYSKLGTARS